MTAPDLSAIDAHGWRQGSVLGPKLTQELRQRAPQLCALDEDWLIVTTHDCDLVNDALKKEPVVEILRAQVVKAADPQLAGGRNPRIIHISTEDAAPVRLVCKAHERCSVPRELLIEEAPRAYIGKRPSRLIAEWLAKRYIRAAFPSEFDRRWRSKMKEWVSLLEAHSSHLQGVYLRLNTLAEISEDLPYRCHLILAVPASVRQEANWAKKRNELEEAVSKFWKQFAPGIEFDGAEVSGTDELTLADIEPYQRFDADWVSFADDSQMTLPMIDMKG